MNAFFRVIPRVSRAIILGLMLKVSQSFAVEIIAHRGASYDAPENSLSSMTLAWRQKTDQLETDIHLSKDGRLVIMHDYDTKRITGVDKKIVDQTWAELAKQDVAKWKGKEYAAETIPTLDSILATIPKGKGIFIEIKVGPEILPELERVMKASGKKAKQLNIITFKLDVAKAAKAHFPKHEVYWLQDWRQEKTTNKYPDIDDLIRKAKEANLDGLDLNHRFPIDKAFVKKVKNSGLKLYTWTVDDPEIAKSEVEAGVDGITTNRPEWLREHLSK